MERKGAEDRCWAPPDAGLFWYVKLTESVDDGFANKLVELRENKRKGSIVMIGTGPVFVSRVQ